MKSIHSIFAAAALSSALCAAHAADRYSLWPRRPAEIEQARRLLKEHRGQEAAALLQPFIASEGIAGREARQMVGSVNLPRYLSLRHPSAAVYTVRRGDNLAKVAAALRCPQDLMMLLNGIVEPSSIHVGQKLVYVPMRQRMEINVPRGELTVWDGAVLVASYPVRGSAALSGRDAVESTAVTKREGYVNGGRVPAYSPLMGSADRRLSLGNGLALYAGEKAAGAGFLLNQGDLNELSLLVAEGAPVNITYAAADIPEAEPRQP